jgi:hypothetical protein
MFSSSSDYDDAGKRRRNDLMDQVPDDQMEQITGMKRFHWGQVTLKWIHRGIVGSQR